MNLGWRVIHNVNLKKDILRACTKTTPETPVGRLLRVTRSNADWAREEIAKLGKDRMEYLKTSLWGGEDVPEPGEGFPVAPGYPGAHPGMTPLPNAYQDVVKGPKYVKEHQLEITIGDTDYLDKQTRFGGNSELANLGIWRFFEYGRRIFMSGAKEGTEWWFIYSPGKGKFGQGYLIQRSEAPSGQAKREQIRAKQATLRPKPVLQTIYFKLNWRLQRQIDKAIQKARFMR